MACQKANIIGSAEGGGRTRMGLLPLDFESSASANFATSAGWGRLMVSPIADEFKGERER